MSNVAARKAEKYLTSAPILHTHSMRGCLAADLSNEKVVSRTDIYVSTPRSTQLALLALAQRMGGRLTGGSAQEYRRRFNLDPLVKQVSREEQVLQQQGRTRATVRPSTPACPSSLSQELGVSPAPSPSRSGSASFGNRTVRQRCRAHTKHVRLKCSLRRSVRFCTWYVQDIVEEVLCAAVTHSWPDFARWTTSAPSASTPSWSITRGSCARRTRGRPFSTSARIAGEPVKLVSCLCAACPCSNCA